MIPLTSIRAAFQKRLKTQSLPFARENFEFKVPPDGKYCELFILPATPVDQVVGSEFYFEVGITQITVIYPGGEGTGPAEGKAQEIRDLFPMNLTLIEDDIQVFVNRTPAQARGYPDGGAWRIPITVSWQAQIIS